LAQATITQPVLSLAFELFVTASVSNQFHAMGHRTGQFHRAMPLYMALPTALLLIHFSGHARAHEVDMPDFDEDPAIEVKDGFNEESDTVELFGMRRRTSYGGFGSPRRRAPAYGGGGYGGGAYPSGGNRVVYGHKSAGSVFKDSIMAAMTGFVLFVLGFPCLWFNEQRQAKMEDLFFRAAKVARTDVSPDKVDPDYERMLVHMKGYSKTEQELSDPQYQLKVTNCAHLTRLTEMYQWVEQEHTEERDDNFGGKETITTYSYQTEWRSDEVSSSSFNDPSHNNPSPSTALGTQRWNASPVTFGAFTLPDRMVKRLCKEENCTSAAFPGVVGSEASPTPGGGGQLPPGLDSFTAKGFLSALEAEYVGGQQGAVGDFFDNQNSLSEETGQQLESLEEQARSSGNPQGFVQSLRRQWGLAAGGVSATRQGPVLPGGWRHMGGHLMTGTGHDVGDMRVTFTKVPCGETTILAVQAGSSFEPMDVKAEVSESGKILPLASLQQPLNPGGRQNIGINVEEGGSLSFAGGCCGGCCAACGLVGAAIESGESIDEIHESHMSAQEVMESAMSSQKMIHLGLRVGGWLLICLGLSLMFDPFPTLFRFIPFLGTYIQTVVGWITGLLAFLLGSFLACMTIGLAWMAAHPAKGIKFLLMGVVCIAFMYMLAIMQSQASSGPV